MNQEELDLLRRVYKSRTSRGEHLEIQLNLGGAELRPATPVGANLSEASLEGVDFSMANLQGADLSLSGSRGACFIATHLKGANPRRTNLWDAYFGNFNVGISRQGDGHET
jgi:uncharacterized protein YjbI with pentapeptide repeats